MERLQTNMLFDGMYPTKFIRYNEELHDIKEVSNIFKQYFNECLSTTGVKDDNELYSLLKIRNGDYRKLKNYYDVYNKIIIKLPERFIFSICGSNGLCSGNTKVEAFN